MNLYIETEDSVIKNHPAYEDNLIQAFGSVPANWKQFIRVDAPLVGPFDVLEGPVYEWDNDLIKDVWTISPMTDEAKAAKIAEYQAMPPPFPDWTLNLETLKWEAPVSKPTDAI